MQTRPQYLFHAVDFHVRVRVHPAVPVAGHCGAALFDGPVAAVAHETDDGYDHGQHGSGQGGCDVSVVRSRHEKRWREGRC